MEGRGGGVPVGAGRRSKTRLGLQETEEERKMREGESVIAWKVSTKGTELLDCCGY